jgi:AraC family transcriptional regulator of adaptative response/methylated-DNA-[protein]-cysteine methyltransferase
VSRDYLGSGNVQAEREFDVRFPVEAGGVPAQIGLMITHALPPHRVMLEAFLRRDASFDGLFVTAVSTTGIFCRPTCSARRPLPEHISFYANASEALVSGYRPCRRCRPLEPRGAAPTWLGPLLQDVEAEPTRRWRDEDLRRRGLSPERVRRWFQQNHGMTFQAYSRARRLGSALGRVHAGSSVGRAALESGYDSLSGFQEAFRQYFGSSPTRLEGSVIAKVDRIATPLGPMLVAATDEALLLLEFADRRQLANQVKRIGRRLGVVYVPESNPLIRRAAKELGEYFAGERRDFTVPMLPVGTEFELEVWSALREIPFGETRSYADIARRVGRPDAVRAVGRANGMNALAIVIPCHRVVGSDGQLVGYGGGLWRKEKLLSVERA